MHEREKEHIWFVSANIAPEKFWQWGVSWVRVKMSKFGSKKKKYVEE